MQVFAGITHSLYCKGVLCVLGFRALKPYDMRAVSMMMALKYGIFSSGAKSKSSLLGKASTSSLWRRS